MSEKRNTWQKQVMYSVIKELKTHPTVQSLIDELEKRGYKIGKSTVYRVLSDAVDEGIVMNVYSGDKMEHFDGNTENHYHIRCKVCDRIFDSELPYQDSITQMGVEADSDFVSSPYPLYINRRSNQCSRTLSVHRTPLHPA